MRNAAVGLLLLAGAGCGGVSKQEMTDMEKRIDTKIDQVEAKLSREITATEKKYASVLEIDQRVKNGVEAIEKNSKLLESANATMIQILQAQRNALKEQLDSVEAQLKALQK